jgi:GT2 family glycosyltransferase
MDVNKKISVVIPVYESQATLDRCLITLEAQSYKDFSVILIDSSPSNECEVIVREHHPWVEYEHVPRRMLPHEARNYGVKKSAADLLIFTDPDICAPPDWISSLVEATSTHAGVIVGSVRCYGSNWLDMGAHIAKFDLWLPGGEPRPIEVAPTLNLLCPIDIFEEVGGFPGHRMIGDTIFSWEVAQAGYAIHFSPGSAVSHHHISTWWDLLHERYSRGREFGIERVEKELWSRASIFRHLLITVLPLRWVKLLSRSMRSSYRAQMLRQALLTLPIIATAHAAWLMGEASGFLEILRARRD